MTLDDRIRSVGRDIPYIADQLAALGYLFDEPQAVFPGPNADIDQAIQRIERDAGSLPQAIKLFWRLVGSVNFMGEHPDWEGCEYADPLIVFPPSVAVTELEEFLDDKENRLAHHFPYLL